MNIMVLSFSTVIKTHLEVIHDFYKPKTVCVIFKIDTDVVDDYGGKTKTTVSVDTKALINAPEDMKLWTTNGILPGGNLLCRVWSLESGGTDYMTREFFSSNRVDNVKVVIGDITYVAMSVQCPEPLEDGPPYWIFSLEKMEVASSV